MENDDIISQEEIDALLQSDDDDQEEAVGESLNEEEIDVIGEIGNIAMGSAATAL